MASKNFTDYSCLIVVIMTHGEKNGILFTYDTSIYVDDLWRQFMGSECPTLVGKPKLFFIQACKGTMLDPGSLLQTQKPRTTRDGHMSALASRSNPINPSPYVIPSCADILIYFCTAEGYYSYRNTATGSWFIQTLCNKFSHYLSGSTEEVDLMRILTAVNRHVAFDRQALCPGQMTDACKQMPTITSMLTKMLIFNRKIQ